jgi:hypothetical protein
MKSTRRRSGPKRPSDRSEDQPKSGMTGPGETFDPRQIADERAPGEPAQGEHRPAPAPSVPISNEEYERLKRKAKTVRVPPSKHRQEDPSGKK